MRDFVADGFECADLVKCILVFDLLLPTCFGPIGAMCPLVGILQRGFSALVTVPEILPDDFAPVAPTTGVVPTAALSFFPWHDQ